MHPMGYGAFGAGLAQGVGLYRDIKTIKTMDDEVKYNRERQRHQDALDELKTDAYLKSLDQQSQIAAAGEARSKEIHDRTMAMTAAGLISQKLRLAEGVEDPEQRKMVLNSLAQGVNSDERLRNLLGLTPDRQVVGVMEIKNPKTKRPAYTFVINNATLGSTGPMTPSGASFGQEPAIMFDVDSLERIAGIKKQGKYINTAKGVMLEEEAAAQGLQEHTPKSSNPPRPRWVNTEQGVMTAEQAHDLGLQIVSPQKGGVGVGTGSLEGFSKARKEFYTTYPNVRPGKDFSFEEAERHSQNATSYGLYLRFNQRKDDNGQERYFLDQVSPQGPVQPSAPVTPGQGPAPTTPKVQLFQEGDKLFVVDPATQKRVNYDDWDKAMGEGRDPFAVNPAPTPAPKANGATPPPANKPAVAQRTSAPVGEDALYDYGPTKKKPPRVPADIEGAASLADDITITRTGGNVTSDELKKLQDAEGEFKRISSTRALSKDERTKRDKIARALQAASKRRAVYNGGIR